MSDTVNIHIGVSNASKFDLGRLVATPNVLSHITHDDILAALSRHVKGDWGDLDEHDKNANNQALAHDERLLSSYRSTAGVKFWIITEWDRSATTVLLPEDY